MEFDADEGAAALSIDLIIDGFQAELELIPGRSLQEAIYLWAFAIIALFRSLDLYEKRGPASVTSSHPPPGVRIDHVIYCARGRVAAEHPKALAAFDLATDHAFEDIVSTWQRLRLPWDSRAMDPRARRAYALALRAELIEFDKELEPLFRERADRIGRRFSRS